MHAKTPILSLRAGCVTAWTLANREHAPRAVYLAMVLNDLAITARLDGDVNLEDLITLWGVTDLDTDPALRLLETVNLGDGPFLTRQGSDGHLVYFASLHRDYTRARRESNTRAQAERRSKAASKAGRASARSRKESAVAAHTLDSANLAREALLEIVDPNTADLQTVDDRLSPESVCTRLERAYLARPRLPGHKSKAGYFRTVEAKERAPAYLTELQTVFPEDWREKLESWLVRAEGKAKLPDKPEKCLTVIWLMNGLEYENGDLATGPGILEIYDQRYKDPTWDPTVMLAAFAVYHYQLYGTYPDHWQAKITKWKATLTQLYAGHATELKAFHEYRTKDWLQQCYAQARQAGEFIGLGSSISPYSKVPAEVETWKSWVQRGLIKRPDPLWFYGIKSWQAFQTAQTARSRAVAIKANA